jgi:hypothetical protein
MQAAWLHPLAAPSSSSSSSSLSDSIRDDVYCYLTARRAVARAALHLGVERMTAESVSVLASCLLEYIARLGAATAATAEAAGRSSAHCHVLDVLAASELCTSATTAHNIVTNSPTTDHHLPSATVLATGGHHAIGMEHSIGGSGVELTTDNGWSTGSSNSNRIPTGEWGRPRAASWKDLAVFCFGPNWQSDDATTHSAANNAAGGGLTEDMGNSGTGHAASGGGGGSSLVHAYQNNSGKTMNPPLLLQQLNATEDESFGWNAPYPDEVPPFPVCWEPKAVANPHTFASDQFSLHHNHVNDGDESTTTNVLDAAAGYTSRNNGIIDTDTVPDAAFQIMDYWNKSVAKVWAPTIVAAAGGGGEKRKASDSSAAAAMDTDTAPPAAKRTKLQDDNGESQPGTTTTTSMSLALADLTRKASHRPCLPSYVPSFFPPFPTHQDSRLVVVVAEQQQQQQQQRASSHLTSMSMTTENRRQEDSTNQRPVRSALVKAAQTTTSTTVHWGSSWADAEDDAAAAATGTTSDALVVPLGRPVGATAAGGSSTETTTVTTASIVPLNRASGSRVSRILEGSMDPPVL